MFLYLIQINNPAIPEKSIHPLVTLRFFLFAINDFSERTKLCFKLVYLFLVFIDVLGKNRSIKIRCVFVFYIFIFL